MKKKICLLILSLIAGLLFAQLASGQTQIDSLNIQGPLQVSPGELVRLVAEIQPEESPFWIVLKPNDLDHEQIDGGRRLIFAVDCQATESIVVMLLAQQVKDGRIVTRQLRRQIKVTAGSPDDSNPDSPAVPNPVTPKQPVDDPIFQIIVTAFSKVTDPVARSKAHLVAANFALVAKQCESGQIGDLPAIWLTLSKLNHQSLDGKTDAWSPLGLALQSEFKRLSLKTVLAHARPLSTAALALDRAAADQSQPLILGANQ